MLTCQVLWFCLLDRMMEPGQVVKVSSIQWLVYLGALFANMGTILIIYPITTRLGKWLETLNRNRPEDPPQSA